MTRYLLLHFCHRLEEKTCHLEAVILELKKQVSSFTLQGLAMIWYLMSVMQKISLTSAMTRKKICKGSITALIVIDQSSPFIWPTTLLQADHLLCFYSKTKQKQKANLKEKTSECHQGNNE